MRPFRIALVSGAVIAGAAVAVWLASAPNEPERSAASETVRTARFIEAPLASVRPVATGHGEARPGTTWQAISRVAGTVIERHAELESGAMLPAGARLIAIDPTDYELAVAEVGAEIAVLEAEREQLEADAESIDRLLEIERDRLELSERELERVRRLFEQGVVPDARVDEQVSLTLQARKLVQELENQLTLLPSRRNRMAAELARANARLERARRDLARTTITAPFDLRIAEVGVERGEYVTTGKELLSADSIDTAEIPAQVRIDPLRRVVGSVMREADGGPPSDRIDLEAIEAHVRLLPGDDGGGASWEGEVIGVEGGLDPGTRTAQVIVSVDEPYRDADPPLRPPLVKNMYVEVELVGQPLPAMVVIPASAVHEGSIYLAGPEDRLEIRPVRTAFLQNGLAVIEEGISPGERVVVDDLVPAIEGMRLDPQPAPEMQRWVATAAGGV